ncbi:MAG: hypothetical protein ACFCUI_00265 [Bernardetiaceae bacterium]
MRTIFLYILFIYCLPYSVCNAQVTTITIYEGTYKFNSDDGLQGYRSGLGSEVTKTVELSGKDSSSMMLTISRSRISPPYNIPYGIILTGDLIPLFEKVVLKYTEWSRLEKQKNTVLEKDMYSKTGLDHIRANHYANANHYSNRYHDVSIIINPNINSESINKSVNTFTIRYERGSLIFEYTATDRESVTIWLDSTDMEQIAKFIASGKFKKGIENIKKSRQSWDEFETIDD